MTTPAELTGSHHDPLDAAIAAYLQQVEAGIVPDRAALLARHPELADGLRACFAASARLAGRPASCACPRTPTAPARRSSPGPCPASATSAITSCWKSSPAAAWGSSTRHDRPA